MNLDARNRASQQRIEQRDRSVGEGAGIDNHPRALRSRLLDPPHELPFMVSLAKCDPESQCCRLALASNAQIVEGFPAVNLGFPGPKQVEIGTVQHVNRLGHGGLETLDTAGPGAGSLRSSRHEGIGPFTSFSAVRQNACERRLSHPGTSDAAQQVTLQPFSRISAIFAHSWAWGWAGPPAIVRSPIRYSGVPCKPSFCARSLLSSNALAIDG